MSWDTTTDMQTITVSAAITQIQSSLQAIDGTSGTAPTNVKSVTSLDSKTLKLNGATSGTITITPAAIAGTTALGIPAQSGNFVVDAGDATIAGIKTFSSSPIVPTPTTDYQSSTKKYVDDAFKALYPVGAIYISTVSTNPNTLLGFGTWAAFAAGRVLVGLNAADSDFDVSEETGGSKTHTLTTAEMPAHTHQYHHNNGGNANVTFLHDVNGNPASFLSPETSSTGSGNAHNNVQPYIVVYMFKRTA